MIIDIEKLPSGGLRFDEQLPDHDLPTDGGEVVEVLHARVRGSARRGRRGVELRARLRTRLRLSCCRCVDPCEHDVDRDFELILVPEAVEYGGPETELDPDAALLYYTVEGKAELKQIVAEQLYLNLPQKPLCRPDCRGLCPTCGGNRNRIECGCRSEAVDPRLAPLLEFKKRPGRS